MDCVTFIKKKIKFFGIDGYIVPKNDEYFSEHSNPDRLRIVSNFTGSAGLAIILKNENFLFVDGRYTLQSKKESGRKFSIFEISKYSIKKILKIKNELTLGYDPNVFSKNFIEKNFPDNCSLFPINENLIDSHLVSKKILPSKKFYSIENKKICESSKSKIKKILNFMMKNKIDNIFISAQENVAWLLNIRGKDNPNSPIPNCRLILTKENKIYFFSEITKSTPLRKMEYLKNINFFSEQDFYSVLIRLNGTNFSIDSNSCSIFSEGLINSKFKIINRVDPCYKLKSIKTNKEIKQTIKAHIVDGVALTKFLYWMKNIKNFNLSEIDAIKKLDKLRKKNKNYLYPSFETIAGSGPNGAIIHYKARKSTCRKIQKKDIFLCDSGGQYKFGTTDVTRTICFQKPAEKIKKIFTMVLKGHISVSTSMIKKKTTGSQLDKKARFWLNNINLDYPHGTGHGVGFFLNVHEGPNFFSKFNNTIIDKGMIMSNEPGYYEKGKFGIRIENLIYVDTRNNKKYFKNLTLVPIDKDLINFSYLNNKEKKYLKYYNRFIYNKLHIYLNEKEKKWLKNLF